MAAGPIANFILAIVIFAAYFLTLYGRPTTRARVDCVQPERGGMKPASGLATVLSIDGGKIDSFSDMQRIVCTNAGEP